MSIQPPPKPTDGVVGRCIRSEALVSVVLMVWVFVEYVAVAACVAVATPKGEGLAEQ